jgi:hypothetical protein
MKKLVSIMLAAAFLMIMYVPVSAAEWNLYGHARVATFYTDDDAVDQTQFLHSLQGNARIGANVASGPIGGRFEYGTGGGNANIRLLYGTVNLGAGQLLVGQNYTPLGINSFISDQVYFTDNGMLDFVLYNGRRAMVQYQINELRIALVDPVRAAAPAGFAAPEVLLPQFNVSYNMNLMPAAALNLGGGFQTYDLDGGDGDTLTAWQAGFNARFTMLNPLYFNLGGYFGQNVGNLGQLTNFGAFSTADIADPNNVDDLMTWAVALVVGTQLDTIGLQAGVGYRNSEYEDSDIEQDYWLYYLQARIPLTADGQAFIVPEVGLWDVDGDRDVFYGGLKWQVNF